MMISLSPTTVNLVYYVTKWKLPHTGWEFDSLTNGMGLRRIYSGGYAQAIYIPVDYLTAISLGLVTPGELGLPQGAQALMEMLK